MTTSSGSEIQCEPTTVPLPEKETAPPGAGQAFVELRGVHLRFRKYGDAAPSLKQAVLNRVFRKSYARTEDFWVLRDLDLTLRHGDAVGLIGPNGAGKSTLLKLIAGIYRPTHGSVTVAGRIVPLIELGAGLNPELSGRENILLLGALLGFSRRDMQAKIGRILDFAGLPDFAETPIKYYSSGMVLRLAFSIATDVDPEILLVDEVFATGDEEFVRKGTQRMRGLMDASHIVVIVSHNLELIQEYTRHAVWLDHGRIVRQGPPAEVCGEYRAFEAKK